ncbi:MAG: hypothetical protein IT443_00785 [Phycisphaeraceae bacterium]|nr:hypothetical protein [Phycisphaeraceae bacterium]
MAEPGDKELLVSEPLAPVAGSFDAQAMARGEPGLPGRFVWRGREYRVVEVLEEWKSSTPEGGSGELYLRRHWFTVGVVRTEVGESSEPATEGGGTSEVSSGTLRMTIYCLRQTPRGSSKRAAKARWWVYTVRASGDA